MESLRMTSERDSTDGDDRLMRVWDETRPAEPSESQWVSLWSRVSSSLDQREPSVIPLPRLSWRQRAAVAVLGLAQAAAMVAGISYLAPRPSLAARGAFVLDEGSYVIRQDSTGLHTIELAWDDGANGLDGNFVMLNALEAMAE